MTVHQQTNLQYKETFSFQTFQQFCGPLQKGKHALCTSWQQAGKSTSEHHWNSSGVTDNLAAAH